MKKFLFALLLSPIFFTGCNSGGGDPKAVLSQFFAALSKKDMVAARKLATEESKSMLDMMESAMKMAKDDAKDNDKFDPKSMEIGEPKIDGDKATVPVKEIKSGESLNYILKKENGSWKVAFDKASMMNMGMEKAAEKGINPADSINKAMDELKDLNVDSLKDGMKKGMEALDSVNKELKKMDNK